MKILPHSCGYIMITLLQTVEWFYRWHRKQWNIHAFSYMQVCSILFFTLYGWCGVR